MYTLKIKASAADIEVPATRSFLGVALLLLLLYRNENIFIVNLLAALLIMAGMLFTNLLLIRRKLSSVLIVGMAAALLALATRAVIFPVVLTSLAALLHKLYRNPEVEVLAEGIRIRKSFSSRLYSWNLFSNVVLKDGVLTLDFVDNRIIQLDLVAADATVEKDFNHFCSSALQSAGLTEK